MDMEEKKLTADAAEQALPVQELPAEQEPELQERQSVPVLLQVQMQ